MRKIDEVGNLVAVAAPVVGQDRGLQVGVVAKLGHQTRQ